MSKSIAIIHGFSGGPKSTKIFVGALKEAGFQELDDATKADVIFAHSAGCYSVPRHNKARLVVLHGPPYWPGKSVLGRLFRHIAHDWSQRINDRGWRFSLRKKWWEIYYAFRYPLVAVRGLRHHRSLDFLEGLRDKKVLLIRNRDDRICSPAVKTAVQPYKNVTCAEVPGHHDDFYVEPEPYIELIKKHLK